MAGGGGLVQLSTDAVLFSIEATYHRSHCWLAAKKWQGVPGAIEPPPEEPGLGILEPPPPVLQGDVGMVSSPPPILGSPTPPLGTASPPVVLRPRNLSPGAGHANRASHAWRSSIAMGLEPIAMEPTMSPFGSRDRSSSQGPNPLSSGLGHRTRSVGNLSAMNQQLDPPSQKHDPPPDVNSGATFDDILGGGEEKEKKSKKKGFGFF